MAQKHVPKCNIGNCVSVDECYSLLLSGIQRANGLAWKQSCDLCFLCGLWGLVLQLRAQGGEWGMSIVN
jgi:hypothetical protein